MSIVMMPRRTPSSTDSIAFKTMPAGPLPSERVREPVRRRGTLEQGRALEALGHAVEYLVDSRLFVLDEEGLKSDSEAVQIMMRLSRAVFSECPEVISLRRRVKMWLVERIGGAAEFN